MTRDEISALLASIAPPGKKQAEKIEAVRKLNLSNFQKHGVELTLETYKEF